MPTLVLCGATDWITPFALSEDIAARIPGSRLVRFEHSGHKPMIEEPETFISTLREFMREPEAVFWTFVFPIVMSVGLAIAFPSRATQTSSSARVSQMGPSPSSQRPSSTRSASR